MANQIKDHLIAVFKEYFWNAGQEFTSEDAKAIAISGNKGTLVFDPEDYEEASFATVFGTLKLVAEIVSVQKGKITARVEASIITPKQKLLASYDYVEESAKMNSQYLSAL